MAYMGSLSIPMNNTNTEEYKAVLVKQYLVEIYNELDALFTDDGLMQGSLLNNDGTETNFKKKLKDFLKNVTLKKCNRAIEDVFDNDNNSYKGIFCSSKSKIHELYNYLNEFEYRNINGIPHYYGFDYNKYKETKKQYLKQKLHKSLIDISLRDKNIQEIIRANPPPSPETSFSQPQETSFSQPQETPPPSPETPPIEDQATSAIPATQDTQPTINDKKTYMSYEEYMKGYAKDRPEKFEYLAPIYKIYAKYEENRSFSITPNNIDNQLSIWVNEQIIKRYQEINGTEFSGTRNSKPYTKPEEDYDELDILIKKIYVEEDSYYVKYTDYLMKKIETEIAIEKTRNRVNENITELQIPLDAYKKYISKLDNKLSENIEYLKNQDNIPQLGGNTKITKLTKKDILGKSRCIYKKSGDRKQYIKHKGVLITVSEYKKIMTTKNK
jgi:hypothetical protein